MGSKTMQVKGAGSQSAPTPMNIAPQRGSEGIFHRGQKLPLEVGFGVVHREKAVFIAEKGSPERVTAGVTQYGGIRKL